MTAEIRPWRRSAQGDAHASMRPRSNDRGNDEKTEIIKGFRNGLQ